MPLSSVLFCLLWFYIQINVNKSLFYLLYKVSLIFVFNFDEKNKNSGSQLVLDDSVFRVLTSSFASSLEFFRTNIWVAF